MTMITVTLQRQHHSSTQAVTGLFQLKLLRQIFRKLHPRLSKLIRPFVRLRWGSGSHCRDWQAAYFGSLSLTQGSERVSVNLRAHLQLGVWPHGLAPRAKGFGGCPLTPWVYRLRVGYGLVSSHVQVQVQLVTQLKSLALASCCWEGLVTCDSKSESQPHWQVTGTTVTQSQPRPEAALHDLSSVLCTLFVNIVQCCLQYAAGWRARQSLGSSMTAEK